MKVSYGYLKDAEYTLREVLGDTPFVIAGGAVRDMLLGRDVKDIDVLVKGIDREERDYEDFSFERKLARQVATKLGGTFKASSESGYESADEEVYATYDVEWGDQPKVNLIFVNSILAALNEFPDELSQVYMDQGGIETSEAFDRIRFAFEFGAAQVPVRTRLFGDNKRLKRLSEKYPEVVWQTPQNATEAASLFEDMQWA